MILIDDKLIWWQFFHLTALGNLGSVLSSQARYKEAEVFLLEAIRFRPNMADAHFNL